MADDPTTSPPFSLKRWSQRKLAAARKADAQPLVPPAAAPAAVPVPIAAVAVADAAPATVAEPAALPPVDSLTFDSDFAAFMQPKIDEATKRAALRKLFSDPSFNVMDGLDIYVGDYTQPDPMPEGMLEKLSAVYKMLDPVEPPPEEAKSAAGVVPPAAATPAPTPVTPAESAAASSPQAPPPSTPDSTIAGDADAPAKSA
jgi:hypothetical protein